LHGIAPPHPWLYVGSLKSRGAKQPYKSGAWSNERRCFSKKKKPARGKQCWLERLSEVEDTARLNSGGFGVWSDSFCFFAGLAFELFGAEAITAIDRSVAFRLEWNSGRGTAFSTIYFCCASRVFAVALYSHENATVRATFWFVH
jgi:hypothetical protein